MCYKMPEYNREAQMITVQNWKVTEKQWAKIPKLAYLGTFLLKGILDELITCGRNVI